MKTAAPRKNHSHVPGLAALLASLSAVGPFSIDAYLPSMGEIQEVMQASPYALQMTLTAYMAPFALMTLWHGAISDALGRRRVVLWGMALFTLASLACMFAQSIAMLLVFRALQGATAGAGMVVGRAIVRDRFQGADAQRVMSQVSLTFALAPAIAPVIGGWLQAGFGWRSVFAFMALYAGAIWWLCRSLLPETLPVERRQSIHPVHLLRAYWQVMTSLRFLALCFGATFLFAGLFLYVAAAPVFLMRHLAVSSTGFFWLFGPLTVGMALGAWLSGRSAGRLPARQLLAASFVVLAATALGNFWYHSVRPPALPWSVLPLFFYSFGIALSFPTLTLLALELFPERRGLAASCQSFIQTSGAAVVAVVAPLVWNTARMLAAAQLAMVGVGLAVILTYRVRRETLAGADAARLVIDSETGV